jgi:ribosomal protein S6
MSLLLKNTDVDLAKAEETLQENGFSMDYSINDNGTTDCIVVDMGEKTYSYQIGENHSGSEVLSSIKDLEVKIINS